MDKLKKQFAIQESYGEQFQYCWGCGPKNIEGMHLKSYPAEDGEKCICHFVPPHQYTGGIPNKLFGGMIAMIFDCHGTASAAWFALKNTNIEFTEHTIIDRFITAKLEVNYKRPVPMDTELTVLSSIEKIDKNKLTIYMEMSAKQLIRATARMIAVKAKNMV